MAGDWDGVDLMEGNWNPDPIHWAGVMFLPGLQDHILMVFMGLWDRFDGVDLMAADPN